jgi:hypothetical protein
MTLPGVWTGGLPARPAYQNHLPNAETHRIYIFLCVLCIPAVYCGQEPVRNR